MGRTTIERCCRLSISRILQEGQLEEGYHRVDIRNHHDMPVWSVLLRVTREYLKLFDTDQRFELESTPLNFGGQRWWFRCPDCKRRCADLYKTLVGRWFSCRKCLRLAYQSAQEAHSTHPVTSLQLTRWIRVPWTRKRDRRPEYRSRFYKYVDEFAGPVVDEVKDDQAYWRERRRVISIVREVQEEIREEIRQLRGE